MAKKGHTMQWLKKETKRQTMFDKTLHIKLKIEQNGPHKKPGLNSGVPEE